jgi:hypothetical protein
MNPALFVSWRSGGETNGQWGPIGRLEYVRDRKVYRFRYTNGARTLPGFRPLIGMSYLEEIYDSDELFPVFTSRRAATSIKQRWPEVLAHVDEGTDQNVTGFFSVEHVMRLEAETPVLCDEFTGVAANAGEIGK